MKDEQKKLITEIMNDDAKDGLYKQQTAVDYLIEQLDEQVYRIDHKDNRINISISYEDMMTLKKQAKQMEKEQIINAFIDGEHQQGFDGEAQQYYNETYGQ